MPRTRQEQFDALTTAISRVLTPVMICMALAVWFVHSLGNPQACRPLTRVRKLAKITLDPSSGPTEESNSRTIYTPLWAGVFIAIFVVLLVVFTFLLVWLYKTGRSKYIKVWLVVAVFLIFAYVGGLYIFDFCRSRCINLDWVTITIAVWNFTITGLFAVFGVVPRVVNQAYLIVMSALMAYIFRSLPSWSIWIILAALVIWDLFAVLSPHGPLNKLVEAAHDRDEPLPALVYDTNPHDVGRDFSAKPAVVLPTKSKTKPSPNGHTPPDDIAPEPPRSPGDTPPNAHVPSEEAAPSVPQRGRRGRRKKQQVENAGPPANSSAGNDRAENGRSGRARAENGSGNEEIRVGTLGAHLKLGLGDFVFYSILVAQASQSGAMTTFSSFVAILAGLCATLFLVTVYRKAMPALPISITAGLLFYFLTRYTVQPFVTNLVPQLLFY